MNGSKKWHVLAGRAVLAIFCLFSMAAARAEPAAPLSSELASEPARVYLNHRKVATLRAQLLGLSAAERARRAEQDLSRLAERGGALEVSRRGVQDGEAILVDGVLAFVMLHGDADAGQSLEVAADRAVRDIQAVLRDKTAREGLPVLIRSMGLAAAASVLALALLWGLRRGRGWVAIRLARAASEKAEALKIGGERVVQRERVIGIVRRVVSLSYWLAVFLVLYSWVGVVFEMFPYTRAWGERLNALLLQAVGRIVGGIAGAVPNLLVALLILLLAKVVVDMMGAFFDRVERGVVSLRWLDEDSVRPTRRLIAVAIWLFAVAMAYPYLPGAQSAAFQGLSVLVGLMVSLGASSIVGQAASGLILMYTRTLRVGEYVTVGDAEGRVMELGIFSTRIRTGLGEDLSVPNSLVLGNVTRNRSRGVQGDGYVIDVSVTIGYDTPWRQVHAMLLEAAERTRGISLNPEPKVYQTALSDFYPEYRLVCRSIPLDPGARPDLISALNASIQDVFNEYGVQIMSPHYIDDGEQPRVVPPDRWNPPPAGPAAGGEAVEGAR